MAVLPMVGLLVAGLVLLAALVPTPAHAVRPWHDIECPDGTVTEGDSFEVAVLNVSWGEPTGTGAAEPFEVYWSTTPGTADERDFPALDRVRQDGNYWYAWRNRRMTKTFQTTEDTVSENSEQFKVWFEPEGHVFGSTECTITITDDDGPGAKKIWVSSDPEDSWGYTAGETISIKQKFTEAVVVSGDGLEMDFNLEQRFHGNARTAEYVSGSGTDTLTFEYDVTWANIDRDGIEIPDGEHDDGATITTQADGTEINYKYQGIGEVPGQIVSGKPFLLDMSVTSTPASGDTYRKGESIDVSMQFNRPVEVEGAAWIRVQIGSGTDTFTQFPYSSGSGTDTLVFQYQVGGDDSDSDGIALVALDATQTGGGQYAIGGTGSVTESDGDLLVNTEFPELSTDPQPEHKVDGRPYVTGVAISSTPSNGVAYRYGDDIDVDLTFDQTVSVAGLPYVPLWIGSATDGRQENAKYASGSLTNTLTFRYDIEENDLDTDGISVPERTGFIGTGSVRIPDTETTVNDFIPALEIQSTHTIDGRLPYIESATFTSSPAGGDTYRLGEDIEVSLTFDKEVEVLGRPTIRLELGDTDTRRDATYSSGDETRTLVFAYTVQATDLDTNGVALTARESDGIDGPFRVYELDTENKVKATITGIASQGAHRVDGRPYVTAASLSSTPANDSAYVAGETIELSLTFDRAVDVDGDPTVKLTVGDNEREAHYESGTGTATLVFEYEVQNGDEDTDGITITANGLALNDGSIEDEDDIGANLVYAAIEGDDHMVDAVAPTFVSADTSTDGKTLTITFSEDVDVSSSLRTLSTFAGVDVGVYLQVLLDVFADDHRMHTSGAEVSGTGLTLTLDSPLTQGQTVTVAYDNIFTGDLQGLLVDDAGNALDEFSAQSVTNNSSLADADGLIWPSLSAHSLTVAEGGTATYTVALASQPDEDVTVSLAVVPGTHLSTDVTSLTFTRDNWDTAQTVTLTSASDVGGQNFWQEIIHTSDSEDFVSGHVKVLIEDNG